jgi:hypothetical protein
MRWLSDTELEITTDPTARRIKSEKAFGKITITYKNR